MDKEKALRGRTNQSRRHIREDALPNLYDFSVHLSDSRHYGQITNGTVEALDPISALQYVIRSYARPEEIYQAFIRDPQKPDKPIATYQSPWAVTETLMPKGIWNVQKDGTLYVDGKFYPLQQPLFQRVH